MKLIERKLPSNHNLFLFSCTHLGSLLSHSDGIESMIDAMESPYDGLPARANFGVHHGDAIEAILIDDRRFHPDTSEVKETPVRYQIDKTVEVFKPVKGKIIAWLEGNHERKLWTYGNIAKEISDLLGVEYGTFSCRMTYKDRNGKLLYKHFATHGSKSITSTADDPERQESNMNLTLKRHLKPFGGDCVLNSKGHTHRLLIAKPKSHLYMTDDGEKVNQKHTKSEHTAPWIHPDHRYYCNVGSFYKIYKMGVSSYVELGEYPPVELGYLVAKCRDRQIVDIDKVTV